MSDDTFLAALKRASGRHWTDYVRHPFVRALGRGDLPEAAFRHYLVQDYLFLLHFTRAHALAIVKSDDLADMRYAAQGIAAILDTELDLHLAYCSEWGLDADAIAATEEDPANLAYTRFVIDRGLAGDLLDLHAALAPCIIGYGEIGAMLAAAPETRRQGNPYDAWIAMYSGADYQALARGHAAYLEDLYHRRGGSARQDSLARIFTTATRLEVGFWQMGLDAAAPPGEPGPGKDG